jgi:hypothetical protein
MDYPGYVFCVVVLALLIAVVSFRLPLARRFRFGRLVTLLLYIGAVGAFAFTLPFPAAVITVVLGVVAALVFSTCAITTDTDELAAEMRARNLSDRGM